MPNAELNPVRKLVFSLPFIYRKNKNQLRTVSTETLAQKLTEATR